MHGLDYDETHAPAGSNKSLWTSLALSAALNPHIIVSDVSNTFQRTKRFNTNKRFCIWLVPHSIFLFRKNFPHISFTNEDGPQGLEIFMNMQGSKEASWYFCKLIKYVFATIGLFMTSFDNWSFVGLYKTKFIVQLCLSTDDYILGCQYMEIHKVVNQLVEQAFNITTQPGPTINYLNYCMIQSDLGISVDQSDHIMSTITQHYKDEIIIGYNTPLLTYMNFDCEVSLDCAFASNRHWARMRSAVCRTGIKSGKSTSRAWRINPRRLMKILELPRKEFHFSSPRIVTMYLSLWPFWIK